MRLRLAFVRPFERRVEAAVLGHLHRPVPRRGGAEIGLRDARFEPPGRRAAIERPRSGETL